MKELILLLKQYKKEIDEYNTSIPEYGERVGNYYRLESFKKVTLDGFLEWLAEGKGDSIK